ncbi:MAG: 30S ribosomal protein S14 [archaeon]
MNVVFESKKYKWPRKKEPGRYCEYCHRTDGLIRKYGLQICRQCFKEKAEELGFKKYR